MPPTALTYVAVTGLPWLLGGMNPLTVAEALLGLAALLALAVGVGVVREVWEETTLAKRQTPPSLPRLRTGTQAHRGSISLLRRPDAPGATFEWRQPSPLTGAQARSAWASLVDQLAPDEREADQPLLARVEHFLAACEQGGGVGPIQRSFVDRTRGLRVEIEVEFGEAFIP